VARRVGAAFDVPLNGFEEFDRFAEAFRSGWNVAEQKARGFVVGIEFGATRSARDRAAVTLLPIMAGKAKLGSIWSSPAGCGGLDLWGETVSTFSTPPST
jgi:hypothetical protein